MGCSEKSGKILQRAGGFVVIKILGEEAEIDEAKVGGQVSLERELVSGIQLRRWTRRIDKPVPSLRCVETCLGCYVREYGRWFESTGVCCRQLLALQLPLAALSPLLENGRCRTQQDVSGRSTTAENLHESRNYVLCWPIPLAGGDLIAILVNVSQCDNWIYVV